MSVLVERFSGELVEKYRGKQNVRRCHKCGVRFRENEVLVLVENSFSAYSVHERCFK